MKGYALQCCWLKCGCTVEWKPHGECSRAREQNEPGSLGSSQHRQKQQQEGSSFSYELFYTIWHVGSL